MGKSVLPTHIIPLSRRKILLSVIGCLCFIGLGILLLITDQQRIDRAHSGHSLRELRVVGSVTIAIFTFFGYIGINRLRNSGQGLILDAKGITIAMSLASRETVKWTQIERITITTVHSQTFLTFHLRNPQKSLRTGPRWIRFFKWINMKFWGSPLHLSALGLQIGFAELITLVEQYHPVERE
ncbi:MAG: STM3941 family protein [Caldilineaceae bacterium]